MLLGLAVYRANAGERAEAARLLDELLRHHPNHVGGLTERGALRSSRVSRHRRSRNLADVL